MSEIKGSDVTRWGHRPDEDRPDEKKVSRFGSLFSAVEEAINFLDEELGPGDRVVLTKRGRLDDDWEDDWVMEVTVAAAGPGGSDLIVTTTGFSLMVVARGVRDVQEALSRQGLRPGSTPRPT